MKKLIVTAALVVGLGITCFAQNKIEPSGNVGIGTTTPLAPLHIKSPGVNTFIYLDKESASYESGITFLKAGSPNFYLFTDNLDDAFKIQSTGFSDENDAAPRIMLPLVNKNILLGLSGGNVGIGTTTPEYALDVNGNGRISGGLTLTGHAMPDAGGLSIGHLGVNYTPNSGNWTTSGSTLLLGAQNYSVIGFHDSGSRVDFIRAGAGTIQLGYNGGFGEANIGMPGSGVWNAAGKVGIGTTDTRGYHLAVAGDAIAESVTVKLKSAWPDYVFAGNYELTSLKETEFYIKNNQHLPGVPSAEETKKEGINVGEMNIILLKKIEELTLHLIEQDKKLEKQAEQIAELMSVDKSIQKK